MSEFKYRWVRTTSSGVDTPEDVEKWLARGWEPAPLDDPMRPPDQLADRIKATPYFALYRLPIEVANERERAAIAENQRLGRPETHVAIANDAIEAYKRELNEQTGRTDAGKGWGPIISESQAPLNLYHTKTQARPA